MLKIRFGGSRLCGNNLSTVLRIAGSQTIGASALSVVYYFFVIRNFEVKLVRLGTEVFGSGLAAENVQRITFFSAVEIKAIFWNLFINLNCGSLLRETCYLFVWLLLFYGFGITLGIAG